MREKKSENLEVRLPHALKQAFMARCRAEGRSASEVVRQMIEAHLARPASPLRPELAFMTRPQIAIPAALAASAGAALLFTATASTAGPDLRKAFEALDRNGDGAVILQEFQAAQGGDVVVFRKGEAPPPAGAPKVMLPLTRAAELDRLAGGKASPEAARQVYATLDADGGGSVDFGEFERHHRKIRAEGFTGLDADRDGRVTGDEFWRPTAALAASPALKDGLRQSFVRLDADEDGAISREEFEAF
ncbi:ribbon-helix-helix protein, CopG family [Phenylobacterium sp.]|jgi:Ca2+-binding EF-hand superfamily protein|uniref:ribbon-helix-helix protein, CopG family n=1 Tax=Phenylobacterium sp. TaxID=1871053 RepID=UPI002E341E4E|nr:ribbon-helix-helix protein, CopG family [Phenylobacterium sp.]HEX2562075.1 ribbon-helix-helix protein, CopG family [Phenylobacterium sp.]